MTSGELNDIERKLQTARDRRARAQGVLESIEDGWEKAHGFRTPEAAEALREDLRKEIEEIEAKISEKSDELRKLVEGL